MDKYMNARIVGNPLGKKACLKFQKKHKEYVLFFATLFTGSVQWVDQGSALWCVVSFAKLRKADSIV